MKNCKIFFICVLLILCNQIAYAVTINTDSVMRNAVGSFTSSDTANAGAINSSIANVVRPLLIGGSADSFASSDGFLAVSTSARDYATGLGSNYTATASWSETFTNTNSQNLFYELILNITEIELELQNWNSSTGVSLDVLVNDFLVFDFSDFITDDGYTRDYSIVDKIIPATVNTIALTTLGVGESFTVEYVASAWSSSSECGALSTAQFGMFGSVSSSMSAVPEPCTSALMGLGLICLAGVCRKKNNC